MTQTKTVKQGRWTLAESRVDGRLQWHFSSSDTLVTLYWPKDEWVAVMEARLESDDGVHQESFQFIGTQDLQAWIKRLDPDLDYCKLCEMLEDM